MKKILIPLIICVLIFGFIITYKGNAKKGDNTMEKPKVDLSSGVLRDIIQKLKEY